MPGERSKSSGSGFLRECPAPVVELVDTATLKVVACGRAGSNPAGGTTTLLYEHALWEIVSGAVSDDEARSPVRVGVLRWDGAV